MSETIDLPGAGPINKRYVYTGAGLAAVFVLWRYQVATSKAKADAAAAASSAVSIDPATGFPIDPVTGLPYDPATGLVMTGGGNLGDTYSVPGYGSNTPGYTGPPIPQNNLQWTQDATTFLRAVGYEGVAVAEALGAYLARATLSTSQVAIAQAAVAALGPPPYGGPYPLVPTPPSTSTVLPISNLVVNTRTRSMIKLMWTASPSPHIDHYHVAEHSTRGASDNNTKVTSWTQTNMTANLDHSFTITAVNTAGASSPGVTITAKTLPASDVRYDV